MRHRCHLVLGLFPGIACFSVSHIDDRESGPYWVRSSGSAKRPKLEWLLARFEDPAHVGFFGLDDEVRWGRTFHKFALGQKNMCGSKQLLGAYGSVARGLLRGLNFCGDNHRRRRVRLEQLATLHCELAANFR